ncbi:MAG TPA: HlyD family efflux transporter periplasmic adaptor subunit [Kofleriaceae bacterium]|nr:HlyD family efflux transporter periplasmic adaptor subunit [Kofleriaceae bacterium]
MKAVGDFDSEGATQLRAFAFVGADRILLADAALYMRAWLREAAGPNFVIEEVDNARDALERLTADPPRVFVVGAALTDVTGDVVIQAAARNKLLGKRGPAVILLAPSIEQCAPVDEQVVPVFYRITPQLQPERVRELFSHALSKGKPQAAQKPVGEATQVRNRLVLEHTQRLGSAKDVQSAAAAAVAAVQEITRAERARCLYYDDDTGELWSEAEGIDEIKASAGITGFVARAAAQIVLERAADDPAYRPAVDDPAGSGEERLLVTPVTDRDGRVHAILIAIRNAQQGAFAQTEANAVSELAAGWAPFIQQLAAESEVAVANETGPEDDIFRQEAIEHLIRRGHKGDVVRVSPRWINAAFWVVLASVAAAIGFAAVARIHQYTEGPAVIRVTGRTDLIAYDGGSVTSVEVAAGQAVKENQVLVRLHDTEQANRMRGLEADFERKLVAYLQSPADPNVRQALSSLVSERESGKANLEARVIRAPHDGIVREVLVNVGQRVDPGKVVVAVARKDVPEGLSALAFLPGGDRPRLHVGQKLRMTLPGYRGATVQGTVRAISSDVIGSADAKARYLGDRLGDSLPISGTVVVVEAQLPKTFEADGQRFDLHDGMVGTSEVQLDSKTVLETAMPGLKF